MDIFSVFREVGVCKEMYRLSKTEMGMMLLSVETQLGLKMDYQWSLYTIFKSIDLSGSS